MHANHRGGDRQSNIEVLRLLSMLMVLNLHSFWGFEHGNGILQVIDFFRECTSICGCECLSYDIRLFWYKMEI